MICKSLVELHQLINSFIAHKCFSNKQHQVWLIHLQATTHNHYFTEIAQAIHELSWYNTVRMNGRMRQMDSLKT